MKYCINNACKAELDDYQERCPYCGRLQIKNDNEKTVQSQSHKNVSIKDRHGFVTFWLWTIIIANMLMAIVEFFPKTMWGDNYPDNMVGVSIFSGILCIIRVLGAYMLLSWNKLGFIIIVISSIIDGLLELAIIHTFPYNIFAIILLWYILKIKCNGISFWDAMK